MLLYDTDDHLVIGTVVQGVYSRTNVFDGNKLPILHVEEVANLIKSPSTGLWLNIQVIGKRAFVSCPSTGIHSLFQSRS